MLSAEEILAGGELTFEVEVPAAVLRPSADQFNGDSRPAPPVVRLRPLTVRDLQLATRAAKEKDELLAVLMVQAALVEPQLSIPQAAQMHVGLLQFLLHEVNRISGISATAEHVAEAVEHPLTRAVHYLAHEYGWTPSDIGELTLGQVLLHLELLKEKAEAS